ncbi:MAG: cobalt ECF transporter T component CbiQ [Parasporobacterium sp.]|nr:cobalt ECF transporter T component CbiQ [Parasporobacterium sp.]
MNRMDAALHGLNEMDALAGGRSPVHRWNPAVKLAVTVLYILLTVSFDKYDLAGIVPMVLYPVIMYQLSGISVGLCFYRLRFVLPLVAAVGLLNPFFDHTVIYEAGSITITGGMVSLVTLMLKGVFCLMASFLLAATTHFDALCRALRKFHVPKMMVTLLLLTYRYARVLTEEASVMTDAYHLRAPGQKGIHYRAWGSFLGQLLLRSFDRAQELYNSMLLRGFEGELRYIQEPPCGKKDLLWLGVSVIILVFLRFYGISQLLGNLVLR